MTKMIDRSTRVPPPARPVYSTAADNQTSVEIHVLQGERQMAKDNRRWAKFQLTGIGCPPRRAADRGHVRHRCQRHREHSAKDLGFGKQQQITISGSRLLERRGSRPHGQGCRGSPGQKHKKRSRRNNCDALVNATEQTLNELGDKGARGLKSAAEEPSTGERLWPAPCRGHQGCHREAAAGPGYKLARSCSQQQGADRAAGAAAGAQPDDGPIEADYGVVDDKREPAP